MKRIDNDIVKCRITFEYHCINSLENIDVSRFVETSFVDKNDEIIVDILYAEYNELKEIFSKYSKKNMSSRELYISHIPESFWGPYLTQIDKEIQLIITENQSQLNDIIEGRFDYQIVNICLAD